MQECGKVNEDLRSQGSKLGYLGTGRALGVWGQAEENHVCRDPNTSGSAREKRGKVEVGMPTVHLTQGQPQDLV